MKAGINKIMPRSTYVKDTIPLIVDNVVDMPGYNMVRFVYFSVDCSDTPINFLFKAGKRSIPVWLIEFQGIIHSPVHGYEFRSHVTIDRLFNAIDDSGEFFVDINDIWMPAELFSLNPERGDVYRVNRELFSLALKFRNDKLDKDLFISQISNIDNGIFYSALETKAFKDWSQLKIREAKEIYPKNHELKLSFMS